jgi:hypothetical protein
MGNATIKPKKSHVLMESVEPGESNIIGDIIAPMREGMRPRINITFATITAIFIILMI